MKILFLTPRNSRKYLGGVEGHVRLLTEELEKRGHKVEELSLDEIDGLNKGPAFVSKGQALGYKFKAWEYLWKKRELFKWADVIHIHDVFWWYFPFEVMNRLSQLPQYYAYLFPWSTSMRHKSASTGYGRTSDFFQRKKSGPSVFATFHGWEGVCPPTLSAVIQKRVAAFLSSGMIGVGNFFEKWYGVKMDRIVWGVVKKSKIKNQKSKIAESNKRIVFFGRLEEVNGIEVLLGALKVTPWRMPRCNLFRFVFVGDGSYRKQAEKYGLVTGMVKNPQKYLHDADVVITSSYMSMLEAVAMGKPIIAIANSKLKEDYLNCHPLRNGIKIVGGVEELAEEIGDKDYKDYKNYKGYTWAIKQTPEKLANEYEELWNLR